jgi:hypothetical protein
MNYKMNWYKVVLNIYEWVPITAKRMIKYFMYKYYDTHWHFIFSMEAALIEKNRMEKKNEIKV